MKTTPDNQKLLDLINDACISSYLPLVVPADRCQEILASHFIETDGLAAMEADDFEVFLDARELSLMTEVVTRLGG